MFIGLVKNKLFRQQGILKNRFAGKFVNFKVRQLKNKKTVNIWPLSLLNFYCFYGQAPSSMKIKVVAPPERKYSV